MKFRFCGDLDCPDWVLAEIATLSKLSSVKMKLLSIQVIKDLVGTEIDYEKVTKITSDAKFDMGDIKGSIACLSFILSSAAKHNVDDESLSNELQQLGLPKEHTSSLCKSYADALGKLREAFQEESMRLSRVENTDWRIDYILATDKVKDVYQPSIQMRLNVRDADTDDVTPTVFTVDAAKFRVLVHELKQAYEMMDKLGIGDS